VAYAQATDLATYVGASLALPVESEIKALKVQGKGGLVMIMHASEMDMGNALQKQIAKSQSD